ncbi:MAG: flavodoxin family protein [Oscillospiraceae bacterium]|nr:flavodoxin family protein [Oscillospiraceae bacterium]MBQ5325531.1 flavodoxin family protein [Oscillospiraceae bacterium]
MKVLMINGSPNQYGCTYTALKEVSDKLNSHGIETEFVYLGTQAVHGCIACGGCYQSGRCVFDDKVNEILEKAAEYDGMVVGSPVYYSGPNGTLCAFLDRLFYCSRGRFANKFAAAVVSCRRMGNTSSLDRLNKYFQISKMHIVSSQYWNGVHGNTPEEVMQDKEGLQIMRTLGENMAWLIKIAEAGKKAGVPMPQYEKGVGTNFIR